ncbi:unnamed protein product [Somion occarium]|uniref:Uncharacterized protein n=1 Tax=Somion occarium TaxID=3059160 RepID=A0ABP1E8X7_9APHY
MASTSRSDEAESLRNLAPHVKQLLVRLLRVQSWARKAVVTCTNDADECYKEYSNLLWKSKDVAGDIRTAAIDFIHAVLKEIQDPKIDRQMKFNVLDKWEQSMQPKVQTSKDLPGSFHNLGSKVLALSDHIRSATHTDLEAIDHNIKTKTDELNNLFTGPQTHQQPSKILARFQSLVTLVRLLVTARPSKLDIPVQSPRRTAPQSTSPPIQTSAVQSALPAKSKDSSDASHLAKKRKNALQKDIRTLSKRRRQLEKILPARDKGAEDVRSVGTDIQDLSPRTSIFSSIYTSMFSEIDSFKDFIRTHANVNDAIFSTKIQSLCAMLDEYAKMMEAYQKFS